MIDGEDDSSVAAESEGTSEEPLRVATLDERFGFLGQDFDESIEALRETHAELAPSAAKLDDLGNFWLANPAMAKTVTSDDRRKLEAVFDGLPEDGITPRELIDRIWEASKDTEWGPELTFTLIKKVYRPRREPIFHNSMLISVVSAFEAHLAKLATEYYRAAPAALHDLPKEAVKEFSLRELQAMNSITDAIDLAIESRVTRLMYGGLSDWKKFFQDKMSLDLAELSIAWDIVREVFERRHCIVHSEGAASRRYVAAIPDVELGKSLRTDLEYVSAAIDALEILGVLLHIAVWSKFADDKQVVIDALEKTAFAALKAERWSASLALYERWTILPLSEQEQRMSKVNIWLAMKGLTDLDAIRGEVFAWDVSGSDELFAFAKLCLLENTDEAFEMVPDLVSREKIDGKSLATWPLTEVLRRDPRIRKFDDIMQDYVTAESEQDLGDGSPSDLSRVEKNEESLTMALDTKTNNWTTLPAEISSVTLSEDKTDQQVEEHEPGDSEE